MHRPRRLPARQHDGRRQRARHRRARLGDLHPRRSHGRRRAADGVLDGSWRRGVGVDGFGHRRRRVSPTGRSCWPVTPTSRGATSSGIDFYVAFAFWKLACILEGVYARYLAGALGRRAGSVRARRVQAPGRAGGGAGRPPRGAAVTEPLRAARGARARVAGRHRHAHRLDRRRRRGADGHGRRSKRSGRSRPIATFDADTFIDYRARRPVMELRDGVNTNLVWPTHRAEGRAATATGGTSSS